MKFIEPDYTFILQPKYDIRDKVKNIWVREGMEMQPEYVEIRKRFWNEGGYTNNGLMLYLYRSEIILLYNYLTLVTGRTTPEDEAIQEMVKKGYLVL